ncbi:sugar ABC transporter ATP-binding protein [Amycolatopsis palatopharyngis]|uniref:sugar ABC transporter ATP-binding protein n=1 Tax=Amycolatopsis palatopharyngis TaxID=187982 RepID=UPI000E281E53|nr:sugar ABC transporter ATP-binding protein [Amycolatopsis palatopharyngis]
MHLHVNGVVKRFGENTVLAGVDFDVRSGEVVALVGENGAGKSTLTRVIAGVCRPEYGRLEIDDQPAGFRTPDDAMARGIQVIYQEFRQNLFPNLSVAENLFVREEGRRFGRLLVSKSAMAAETARLLGDMGMTVDPQVKVGRLSVAEQQMVEIAKVMTHDLRMLILDEPTAALDGRESEELFRHVERLRGEGVAIVYITHRLDEVFALADRVVVLRDGAVALTGVTCELTREKVVSAMVGRTVDDLYPKQDNTRDDIVLSVCGLGRRGVFEDIDLDVRAGEIVGLGGVLGSGRGDVLRTLFGLDRADSGTVSVHGKPVNARTPAQAIRSGIAYLTPDRQAEGLCTGRTVRENISLAALADFGGPLGLVRRQAEKQAVDELITELRVHTASREVAMGTLSGGNQQKTLFAKWLMTRPLVLLMEEPTRGVDVGAKAEIYRLMNELTARGVAIVLVSSDLPELVAMSDRVLVLRQGRIAAQLHGGDVTQHAVLEHALEAAA